MVMLGDALVGGCANQTLPEMKVVWTSQLTSCQIGFRARRRVPETERRERDFGEDGFAAESARLPDFGFESGLVVLETG